MSSFCYMDIKNLRSLIVFLTDWKWVTLFQNERMVCKRRLICTAHILLMVGRKGRGVCSETLISFLPSGQLTSRFLHRTTRQEQVSYVDHRMEQWTVRNVVHSRQDCHSRTSGTSQIVQPVVKKKETMIWKETRDVFKTFIPTPIPIATLTFDLMTQNRYGSFTDYTTLGGTD